MRTGLETREELFAVMEQIAEEREAARPIVRELVESARSVDDIEIPEEWRTAGMVMEIIEFAYGHLEIDPPKCLSFSLLALALATDPRVQRYPAPTPAYLKGRAWREVGHSHRFMSASDTAIRAQTIAEVLFAEEGALAHDRALAAYARSGTLFKADRFALASEANEVAAESFREFGDLLLLMKSEVVAGCIDIFQGNFDGAREKFERVISERRTQDLYTLGMSYSNLAICERMSGRRSAAVTAAERAREIFTELEMPSEVTRTDWGLALILLEDDPLKALPILERVRADFLSRHMRSDAGEVGLCIVDALVATGQ
ncbi:MAG TPA: hypothetical protein VII32_01620, partial [Thermoanaerobaculia bacterium]